LGRFDRCPEGCPGGRQVFCTFEIFIVKGEIGDRDDLQIKRCGGEFEQGMRSLAIERGLTQAANEHRNLVFCGHVGIPP
jgi:hypothetical protein